MREEEAKARLEFARRVGSMQAAGGDGRGSGGVGSGGGLEAARQAVQLRQEREMEVVRRQHQQVMEKMAAERDKQVRVVWG